MLTAEVSVSTTNNIGPKAREGVLKFLEAGAERGGAVARDRVPVSSGTLLKQITDPERDGNTVFWGVFDADHARPMEFGTAPYWPPIEPLKKWARRAAGDEDFAYYVQWKIAQTGIKPHPFMRPARKEQINWYRKNDAGEYIEREFR